jgi:hypothetical protein
MYGVVKGAYICQSSHVNDINDRIASRNIPSSTLQETFDPRPVETRCTHMSVSNKRKESSVPIIKKPVYNINKTFNPGNGKAPWAGYAINVSSESSLRNQFFALQKCEQSEWVPSSNSDLYSAYVTAQPGVKQTHPGLFKSTDFSSYNPNSCNIANELFNNHTRQQIKDL